MTDGLVGQYSLIQKWSPLSYSFNLVQQEPVGIEINNGLEEG